MEFLPPVSETAGWLIPSWEQFVDYSHHEIGLYSVVEAILIDGVKTYETSGATKGKYKVIPQFPVLQTPRKGSDFPVDLVYRIVDVRISVYVGEWDHHFSFPLQISRSPIALVEVIGSSLKNVDVQQLSQILVQAYYCVHQYSCEAVLVALTDTITWHFLRCRKAPTTTSQEASLGALQIEWAQT